MKILIIASLHHPEQLAAARASTPAGQAPPLFPPSMAQHFWERGLRALGHEVHAFYRTDPALPLGGWLSKTRIVRGASQRMPTLNPDYQRRNARLLEVARRLRPELVLLAGDNEVIFPATLAQIKAETGATLVYTCGTSPIVFSHANERAAARLYDLVVASDYYHGIQWRELGAPRMEALPVAACDPGFHYPRELNSQERMAFACDVAFVGTLSPPNLFSRRANALEFLAQDTSLGIGIWSVHPVPETLQPHLRGKALGDQMLRILSGATIAFNTHGDFVHYGGNMRLFECAAVGAFQIAEDLPGTRTWFTPDEQIVLYTDLQDLRAKVMYYLAHPAERQRIAANARQHVLANHTYQQRMARIIELVAAIRQGE